MNNFPYLIPISPSQTCNYIYEIQSLKEKIKILEERINKIENQKQDNYLKKDDNYHMI